MPAHYGAAYDTAHDAAAAANDVAANDIAAAAKQIIHMVVWLWKIEVAKWGVILIGRGRTECVLGVKKKIVILYSMHTI